MQEKKLGHLNAFWGLGRNNFLSVAICKRDDSSLTLIERRTVCMRSFRWFARGMHVLGTSA